MPWQLLRLRTTPDQAEEFEQRLLTAGATSVTLADAEDQPVFQIEPGATPLWDSVQLSALFDADADLQPLLRELQQRPGSDPADESAIIVESVPDQDWEKAWMDRFHPLQFGTRLWICPSWLEPPDPDAVNILLDPGLAFGTGTHPTTALCLEWLEQQDLSERLVIDYGCGSGVLAIAAALLGAGAVLAVDNDPQAIQACTANRDANGLDAERLACYLPEQFPPGSAGLPADVLIANILAGPLEQLAPHFAELVRPGGDLVLSGILPDQAELLLARYEHWFDMQAPVERDQWTRLSGTRRYS
ncbi:MAG: 50S ribosomal protein L11 methyltransferase [Gammaproteobacteria bacterium]|nr:50S ribosomal protein L11 methyltransferase [Pseudomonadales bacterium]MCP5349212.1 50S ribosomal protein L11 methyltransferase [Pseudomonadales bacterium]